MRIGRRVENRIADNRGISLLELIAVIAIMAVMVGVASFSVGVMFTKDANYVAVRIDDELTEARTLSMSKKGDFTYVLHYNNDAPETGYITILRDETGSRTEFKKVAFDKSVKITVTGTGMPSPSPTSGSIGITFNKAKGNVQEIIKNVGDAPTYTINDADRSDADGVYTIKVEATRNSSRTSIVTLVATTGRHYTEN